MNDIMPGRLFCFPALTKAVAKTRWSPALEFITPFLQPLYSTLAACRKKRAPSHMSKHHAAVAKLELAMLSKRLSASADFLTSMPGESGADASAHADSACIGGWRSSISSPKKWDCWWFSVPIQQESFPWVWQRAGDPRRVIAALEMLALVVLTRMIAAHRPDSHCRVRISGLTDSQSDAFAVLRHYSKRMPTAAVHTELAATAWATGTHIAVSHTKRDGNMRADELTNGRTVDWNPVRRYDPDFHKYFLILDDLMESTSLHK